jgi:TetR/AcrR family transcriptional regulator, regulator of biofilm formation and stress response
VSRPSSRSPKPRGATDRERRLRITQAAIDVVGERGVAGLTHRAVAQAAGVPLGSTTYHFATLDDILEAALRKALEDNREHRTQWGQTLPANVDLAEALADLTEQSTGPGRARVFLEYELYLAALRHPSLRALSREWNDVLVEVLLPHTDALTARALATLNNGLELESIISGKPTSASEALPVYRRVISTPH